MKNFLGVVGVILAIIRLSNCCSCIEPNAGEEVCGSDGNTYQSPCILFCSGFYRNASEPCLTEVHKGPCKGPKCVCKDTCKYVCASNGQSFGNDCTLRRAQKYKPKLKKVKDGRCGECACQKDLNWVCGSDGQNYPNICELNCRKEVDLKLTKKSNGKCPVYGK